MLFHQALKSNKDKSYICENKIMECITKIDFMKSRHIKNIISENAKLAIRDFID